MRRSVFTLSGVVLGLLVGAVAVLPAWSQPTDAGSRVKRVASTLDGGFSVGEAVSEPPPDSLRTVSLHEALRLFQKNNLSLRRAQS